MYRSTMVCALLGFALLATSPRAARSAQSPADPCERASATRSAASPKMSSGKRWAVVIGINNYQHSGVRKLQRSVSDAERLYETLTQPTVGGVPKANATLLTSDSASPDRKPTKANILKALQTVSKKAGPNDIFWFYFAGHGTNRRQYSYLLPMDYKVESFEQTALSVTDLRKILETQFKVGQKIVILDSCHSGSTRSVTPVRREEAITPKGTVTLAAAKVDQEAWEFSYPGKDGLKGGVFTHYLIKALAGDADGNKDGLISACETKQYLTTEVNETVKKMEGVEQTPVVINKADTDVLLAQKDEAVLEKLPEPAPEEELTPEKPLGPVLVVSVDENRAQAGGNTLKSNIVETEMKRLFLAQGFQLVNPDAARELSAIRDPRAAAAQAAKMGAAFLVRCQANTSAASLVPPFTTVTATLTAELVDEQGNVLSTPEIVDTKGKAGGTELKAATLALKEAAAALAEKLMPAVAKAMRP